MLYPCVSPQGHNIFSNLSSTEYSDLMQLLKQSILATDLTLYFEYVLLNTLLFKLLSPERWYVYSEAQWQLPSLSLDTAHYLLLGNTAPLWISCNLQLHKKICFLSPSGIETCSSSWSAKESTTGMWRVTETCAGSVLRLHSPCELIQIEFKFHVKSICLLLRSMMMTACDLGAVTKPWEISRKVTNLIIEAGCGRVSKLLILSGNKAANQSSAVD